MSEPNIQKFPAELELHEKNGVTYGKLRVHMNGPIEWIEFDVIPDKSKYGVILKEIKHDKG